MSIREPSRRPVSTYRLQLHGGFGFRDAAAVVPYLARLGITDAYSSPHFKANPGSRHGYDICDHSALNPELGSEADYDAWCRLLRAAGLGHIIDIVPNHMSADPRSNAWWRDVLENGPSSPYSHYFDIDWDPVKPELRGKVLLPVLGDQYGRVLERGELQLVCADGALQLRYFDLDLPVNPRQSPRVLGLHVDRLELDLGADPVLREYLSILTALQNLPPYTERDPGRIAERQREKEVARVRLARLLAESVPIRRHVEAALREANGRPGDRASFDRLHDLLEHQAYRLAYWRTAADEINYRRFFDINELVALRMEEREVFDATHALLRRLIARGAVTGVRVDHPDGLFDPAAYFERLQAIAGAPLFVAAEKILALDESLDPGWPVAGTTGYAFLNLVSGLFIDGRHVRTLRRVYARLTGRTDSFEDAAYRSRLTLMLTAMASELNVLAEALNALSETDRRSRDFTLNSCRRALREVTACFPVYRSYVGAGGASAVDRRAVAAAIADARRRNPVMEASIFDFLQDVLLPDGAGGDADPAVAARLHFARKVQQFTAPVHAKGVEDTAFYRHLTLISANDVGGRPARPSVSPEEFHAANARRLADWPLDMLATSTHDTKRGEDARMRVNALSEMPVEWRRACAAWMRTNGSNRLKLPGGWAPDRNDEYLFYQTLVAIWPAEPASAPLPDRAPDALVERVLAYMVKAVREAKVHTSWVHQDEPYEQAVERFVARALTGRTSARFLGSFVPFQRRVARAGMVNSLAQLALKLAAPGVADFYQGTELWDLTLVDPDNRRPVDFDARARLLDDLDPLLARLDAGDAIAREVAALVEAWPDARIKLFLTARGLRFRRDHPDLILKGTYVPLDVDGAEPARIVGFARRHESQVLVTVVPRLTTAAADAGPGGAAWPPRAGMWHDTRVLVPAAAAAPGYRHLLTGEVLRPDGRGALPADDLFRSCPVALLSGEAAQAS
jgi:(1->4)-alpha-D-glucan 1-alpha-D-glucosylmutase